MERTIFLNWAAIFDWDGVIVDSSSYHEESWEILARDEHRALPPDHFKRGFGMKNEVIIPQVLGWATETAEVERLARKKEKIYRELVDRKGLTPMAGVVEWLTVLRNHKVLCVIASSTQRLNIDCAMKHLRIEEYFAGIVAGDDVIHGKPHPDIFLKAAKRIEHQPGTCVVFEDAHVGIEAARAAGMKVVAVTTTHPAASLTDADVVVDRLDELTIPGLSDLFA